MEFRDKLQKLRKENGLTQEMLAERINVSSQTVSKWERGLVSPDIKILPKLAVTLRTSIDNLLCIEDYYEDKVGENFISSLNALRKRKNYEGIYRRILSQINLRPEAYELYTFLLNHIIKYKMYDKAHITPLFLLCERIETNCEDDFICNQVYDYMTVICGSCDDKDIKLKAREYYDKVPSLRHSKELLYSYIYEGEELQINVRNTVLNLCEILASQIRSFVKNDTPPREKIKFYKDSAKIFEFLIDGKYGGVYYYNLFLCYSNIAYNYFKLEDKEQGDRYTNLVFEKVREITDCKNKISSFYIANPEPDGVLDARSMASSYLKSMRDKKEFSDYFAQIDSLIAELE